MRRIEPFFPLSLGIPIVDDRRVISGIIFVIRNGLRWRDAPAANGPPKAIYNRFKRWSEMGVFARIFLVPAKVGRETSEPNVDYANSLEKPVPDHAQKFFAFSFWDKRAPLDSTSTASGAVRARFPGRVAIPSARKMRDGALKT
jgi:transposase